jgi:hypothetical protein
MIHRQTMKQKARTRDRHEALDVTGRLQEALDVQDYHILVALKRQANRPRKKQEGSALL